MSYRCAFCLNPTPKGVPMLKKTYLRENGQIEREVPICGSCDSALDNGVPADQLGQTRPQKQKGKEMRRFVPCDLCGQDATDGQSTTEGVICPDCLRKRKGRNRTSKKG